MTQQVLTEIQDGVIIIRLNRADKKNALTGDMYNAISDALDLLERDNRLRVGLITGTKDCFTAGNDLVDFMQGGSISGDSPVGRFLATLPALTKPLVAAVNGPAVGVGTTMLLHCDLVYAAPGAKFQMPFINLGLCPEAGSSLLLPQLVGYRRATELLMLCDAFSADEGRQMGIVNDIIAVDDYQQYALEQALRLARQPPSSIRAAKRLMRMASKAALKAVMDEESAQFSAMLNGGEAKEAFSAFFEKRQPDFSKF